ncbi:MAG: hypothetical protein Q7J34_10670, partial [Bacteroidales bacterium]|nr:hypothetical protein [Bacteroidales bacterium]
TAASPQPTLNDTIVCLGSPVLLDAGAGYASYLWSTGASSQSILVYLAGVYTVSVSNASGCQGSAQATVSNLPIPSPKMIKHE